MPIAANVASEQITVSVGETQIDVSVGGGVGPTGSQGPSGTVAVSAPITNAGTSTAAVIGLSVGAGLAVSGGSLAVTYGTTAGTTCQGNDARLSDARTPLSHTHTSSQITDFASAVVAAAPPTTNASLLTSGTLDAGRLPGSVVLTSDARLTDAREWSASTASQADAEAGTSTSRFAFTPQRVFQAIAAWWAGSAAKSKLDGIATGATANATDAQLRDRSTHTGTQLAATISDFTAAVVAAAPPTTDASLLTTGTLSASRLPSTTVAAGSYGSASSVATFTVGADGRLTAAGSSSIAIAAGAVSGLAAVATSGNASDLGAGTVPTARLGSGTANSTTFLRGDGAWAAPTASVSAATTTTLGGVIVPTSGNLTVDGSGNLSHAESTFSQARDAGNATVFMSPRRVRDLLQFTRKVELPFSSTASGGSVSTLGDTRVISTGTTVQGHAAYHLNGPGDGFQLFSQASGATTVDWAKPHWFSLRLWRGTGSTNGILRVLYGVCTTGAPGATPNIRTLTGAGIGLQIVGRRLWIVCHNGTTLATFDTGFDTEADGGRVMDFLVYTNGANTTDGISTTGTVTVTYSTQSTGPTTYTTTGGPTADATGSLFLVAITNATDAVAHSWRFVGPTLGQG